MNDSTTGDVARTLYLPSATLERRPGMPTVVVMDLRMGVEALRRAMVTAAAYHEPRKPVETHACFSGKVLLGCVPVTP